MCALDNFRVHGRHDAVLWQSEGYSLVHGRPLSWPCLALDCGLD